MERTVPKSRMKVLLLIAAVATAVLSPSVFADPIDDCVRATASAPMNTAGRRMMCRCIAAGGSTEACAKKAMNAGY